MHVLPWAGGSSTGPHADLPPEEQWDDWAKPGTRQSRPWS